jgi:hypothetical protein
LCDRRRAAQPAAASALRAVPSLFEFVEVEAPVVAELVVFGRDYGADQMRRYAFERYPLVMDVAILEQRLADHDEREGCG